MRLIKTLHDPRASHALMVALVFAVSLASVLFAERILLSQGLGMDGTNYGAIAADFRGEVFERGVNQYYLKRAAPSAIVHYGLRAFGHPTDFAGVVLGFQWYELALLVLVALLWKPIADELRLGLAARWLGFVALFVNYANLKHAFYMPVFTDVTAFALGAVYLLCWLKRWQAGLLAATLVGAFCWPIAALAGAMLLAAPRGTAPAEGSERTRLPTAIALGIALALLAGFSYMYFVRDIRKVGQGPTIPAVEAFVPLAMILYAAWVIGAYRTLLAGIGPRWIGGALRAVRPLPLLAAVAAVAVPAVIVRLLALPDEPILGTRGFLRMVMFSSQTRPLLLLVGHVVWFGPVVWLLVFFWRDVCRFAQQQGAGLIAFLGFSVFVALTPESRQSNLGFPFFVALLCAVARPEWLSARLVWILGIVGLAFSKIWMRINTEEAVAYALSRTPGLSDAQSAFQYRMYYLSQAPWMPNRWYVIQGLAVLLTGVLMFVLVRRGLARRPATAPSPRGEVLAAS